MSLFNNITEDFLKTLNTHGTNPFVLVVLVFIILIYYVIFAFLGNSDFDSDSNNFSHGGFIILEALLWALLILLVFVNGLAYFFNINVVTELKNIFSEKPEIEIESTVNETQDISGSYDLKEEVYHIPGNRFSYHDAKAVCKAFDGELASYEQLAEEQKKGASWCRFGWTKNQLKNEYNANSWIIKQNTYKEKIIIEDYKNMWKNQIKLSGSKYDIWLNSPENPNFN